MYCIAYYSLCGMASCMLEVYLFILCDVGLCLTVGKDCSVYQFQLVCLTMSRSADISKRQLFEMFELCSRLVLKQGCFGGGSWSSQMLQLIQFEAMRTVRVHLKVQHQVSRLNRSIMPIRNMQDAMQGCSRFWLIGSTALPTTVSKPTVPKLYNVLKAETWCRL